MVGNYGFGASKVPIHSAAMKSVSKAHCTYGFTAVPLSLALTTPYITTVLELYSLQNHSSRPFRAIIFGTYTQWKVSDNLQQEFLKFASAT